MRRQVKLRHYSVLLSAYSELTEIKTFTGINLAQSLHVCLCDIYLSLEEEL